MKQIFVKDKNGLNFTVINSYSSLAGIGNASQNNGNHPEGAQVPMPIGGTFRNLTFYCANDAAPPEDHEDLTFTLMVNEVATALTVSLPQGVYIATNSSDEVVVVEGDAVCFRCQAPNDDTGSPGYSGNFSVEFEGDKQFYSIQADTGGVLVDSPRIGGVLGNGGWQNSGSLGPSNSYSIAAMDGIIDKIVIQTYAGQPLTGVWNFWIIKNGVLQDGSGGTVDTFTTMTGTDEIASSTFSLPVAKGDILDYRFTRTVINAPSALGQVAASCTFVPDSPNDNAFMQVGGSNNSIDKSVESYIWEHSEQEETNNDLIIAPVGVSGYTVHGIYINISTPPGTGKTHTFTLIKNGVDTGITVSLSDAEDSGLIVTDESFVFGDMVAIKINPDATGNTFHLYWGLYASVEEVISNLIVTKVVSGGPEGATFSFTTTGGLSPDEFTLEHGQTQDYLDIEPGTYGVTETPDANYTTTYEVSNDDEPDAIELAEGETVIVTVTNTFIEPPVTARGGIYKIVPWSAKPEDTLWIEPGSEETFDVKIPDPTIKTGLIGD